MRITGLKIDGFGVWSGLELADLAGDVNVFYGPNEAGKTTLVEFVRSIFYGFSPERRAQYLPPVRGGRPGGAIHLVADGKSCHVSRHADEPGEPSLIVVDQTGHSPEEPLPLSALLGGVPEGIFKNVFVFGLREIQELGSLSDSEAADELYNLALGMDGVSLVGVLDELETSRNRLLARDERPSLIVQLVAQRERLHNEIETLSGQTLRYFTLSAHRERLAGDIRRLEEESVALDHRARELALAASLAERWRRRSELDQRLQAVGSWGAFPADALPRFDRVQSRLQARRLRLTRLKDQRRSLRNQIYQLNIHEPLCREALRLEALAEQQQWIASLETELASLETEIGQLQTEHQESCRRLGISTKAGKAAEDSSSRVLDELRAAARSVAETRRDMRQLTTQATTVGETPEEYRRKLAAALGDAKDKTLTQRLTEAGELVSTLRQRVQLDGRIDQMSRREAELDDEQDGQVEKQMLPGWALGGLGAAFVLGCALVLLFAAGMVLPAPLGSALGWPFGLVGVVMVASASGLKIGLERTAAGQLNSLQSQLQSLSQQMEEAKNERDELDQHLPRSGGPLVARLKTAEGELARLEELLPLEAKRTAAEREAQTVAERLAGRQADHRRARENWRRLVAQFDLPAELKPNDLGEFWRRRGQLRALDQSLASKRDELDRLRSQYETVARRIGQIVLDVGLTPPSGRPLEQLRYCLTELAEQKSRMKRRDELGGQIDRLGRRYSRLRQAIEKLVHRRQLLMKLAGTLDEQEFRRRAAARAEAEGLAAERDHLTQEITAALAGQSTEDRLAAWMSTPQPIDLADAQLAQDRQAHAAELSQALEARG
ncbi:MAG TPA: AAA family ATPase, partial [Pirellulales bacterium]|nr:AAA family ATPase [Pirellulales bacterium]